MVKRRNPHSYLYPWIQSLRDQGVEVEESIDIVARYMKWEDHLADVGLLVEHCYGLKQDQDIEHLCPPDQPSRIEYVEAVADGHVLRAAGVPSGDFEVLLTVRKPEARIRQLVEEHNAELCALAFKNAHQGYPYEIFENRTAKAGIHMADVQHLLI